MKKSFIICFKLLLLCFFLLMTPFIAGLKSMFSDNHWFSTFLYTGQTLQLPEITSAMNMMVMVKKEDIPQREIDIEELPPVPLIEEEINLDKTVYIYSTHQQEAYMDQNTVVEASLHLASLLEEKGIHVQVESADFALALQEQGLNYNDSYLISRNYLIDALMSGKGYDLIVDFHRDSLPRESAYVNANGKNYAKMMCVLGGLSENQAHIYERTMTLFDKSNTYVDGIMKSTMNREAYYNQDIHENMMLIEVGSDQNTYEEIENSVQILADAITEMLKEEE